MKKLSVILLVFFTVFLAMTAWVSFGSPQIHKTVYHWQVYLLERNLDSNNLPIVPKDYTGPWKDWTKAGLLTSRRHYKDGELHGLSETFKEGVLVESTTYRKGRLHGPHTVCGSHGLPQIVLIYKNEVVFETQMFHPNGTIRHRKQMLHGKRHGVEEEFTEDGFCFMSFEYKDGLKDGKHIKHDPQTRFPITEIHYLKNKLHGIYKNYDENGQLSAYSQYAHGQRHGLEVRYNKEGDISDIITHKEGQREGLQIRMYDTSHMDYKTENGKQVYFRVNENKYVEWNNAARRKHGLVKTITNGQLSELAQYKEGRPHGLTRIYDKGRLQEEVMYVDGKKNGLRRIYFPETGHLKSEGLYVNNKPHGIHHKHFPNGGIEYISYFDNGTYEGYERYDEFGFPIETREYDAQQRPAKIIEYGDEGLLESITLYEGHFRSQTTTYHPNGKAKSRHTLRNKLFREYDDKGHLILLTHAQSSFPIRYFSMEIALNAEGTIIRERQYRKRYIGEYFQKLYSDEGVLQKIEHNYHEHKPRQRLIYQLTPKKIDRRKKNKGVIANFDTNIANFKKRLVEAGELDATYLSVE